MTVRLSDGVLAFANGVPQLDCPVPSARHNLRSRAESVKLAPATALQSAFYGVCQKGNKKNSSNTLPISQGQSGHPQDDMPSLWLPATISGILASTPGCC